jgi:hypothetical protein
MSMNDRDEFCAKLDSLGICPRIAEWISMQMVERWKISPTLEQRNDIDPDDWVGFILEGTVELCRFRPNLDDLRAASIGHKFGKFIEFAEVIDYLCKHAPPVKDAVVSITPENCSENTRELWRTLSQFSRYEYNDQFVIQSYLSYPMVKRRLRSRRLLDRFWNSVGRKCLWRNTFGIERDLRRYGYIFQPATNLSECQPKSGDILKIAKVPGQCGDLDKFVLFALVADANEGQIGSIEFKLTWNSPLKASAEGFNLFFFRDPETRLQGAWKRSAEN